jgi:hypothetical protein
MPRGHKRKSDELEVKDQKYVKKKRILNNDPQIWKRIQKAIVL